MKLSGVDGQDVFKCNICMDHPRNSVLTSCGHLFCWSCLHGWLQHQEKPCPMCKLMVKDNGIIPIYGCQRGSSSKIEDALPPRPHAPAVEVGQSNGNSHPTGTPLASYFNAIPSGRASMQDVRIMEYLRLRAQADFQTIRAFHPPSSVGWIAEASHEFGRDFDPALQGLPGEEPVDDVAGFVFRVLVPQGEVFPAMNDFRSSWLPYYEVQNPELNVYDHYNEFVAAWAEHFHSAWIRAGRPVSSSTNRIEASNARAFAFRWPWAPN